MIKDKRLELADKQVVTANIASENRIDFGHKSPTTGGNLTPLYAVFTVDETFKGISALTIRIQHSDQETSAYSDVASHESIPVAKLVAGASFVIPMPHKHKRYLQAYFAVSGSGSAGKISANLVQGFDDNQALPDSPRAWGGR